MNCPTCQNPFMLLDELIGQTMILVCPKCAEPCCVHDGVARRPKQEQWPIVWNNVGLLILAARQGVIARKIRAALFN